MESSHIGSNVFEERTAADLWVIDMFVRN